MLIYIVIAVIGIAFLSSLRAFRLDFPLHLKVFSLLLGLDFLVEFFSTVIVHRFHLRTNVPLYNCFMLVEFWIYGWFFRTVLTSPLLKRLIGYYLVLLPVFWVIVVFFVFGLRQWNSYLAITGSLFTVSMAAAFYFQLFTAPELTRLTSSPEFWIATGLIILYTCDLPYLGTLNFMSREYLPLAKKLLFIIQLLNIIMYSLFTMGFLCRTSTMRLSSP